MLQTKHDPKRERKLRKHGILFRFTDELYHQIFVKGRRLRIWYKPERAYPFIVERSFEVLARFKNEEPAAILFSLLLNEYPPEKWAQVAKLAGKAYRQTMNLESVNLFDQQTRVNCVKRYIDAWLAGKRPARMY